MSLLYLSQGHIPLRALTVRTEYCQPWKLTWAFGVESFYWGSIKYCLHGQPLVSPPFPQGLVSIYSRSYNRSACLKTPIISNIVRPSCGHLSERNKDTSSRRTSQRPSNHLSVAKGKGQTSIWVQLILQYTVVNDIFITWEHAYI